MHEHTPVPRSAEEDAYNEDFHSLSWSAGPGPVVIKKTDRPFFLFRETIIPEQIREFFDIGTLPPGKKRGIVLWREDTPFDAFIEMTSHHTPRTRMMWKPDFAAVLHTAWPQWVEFFKKNRDESGDTPSVYFTRRDKPHHYDVSLEDAPAPGTNPKVFHVPLKPGDTIDNETLRAIFHCGPEGTMRPSLTTGSLVIVSDHTSSVFQDTWMNNFFHYTGRGLGGKEGITLSENRMLVESNTHGISLYLFEVFEHGHYVYMGEVELSDKPFLSRQPDREKNIRDVCIFPLKLIGHKRPPLRYRTLQETTEELGRRKPEPSAPAAPYSVKGRRMHKGTPGESEKKPLNPKNLILIGMPGAGKSTMGVILAKTLGMKFIDTDIVIQETTGRLLQEIIDTDGPDAFKSIEERTILSLHGDNTVIATGGSVVFSGRAMEYLKSKGKVIYLTISGEEMARRLKNITTRGIVLIAGQGLGDMYIQRVPLYEQYADITIDCSRDNFETCVEKVIDML